MKDNKKYHMKKNLNDDSDSCLNKLKNFRVENRNSSIDKRTVSPYKKNSFIAHDLKYNSNLKFKKFTNDYNNTINNYYETVFNFANTNKNFHTYNPSINSINTTINNPYTKNHFMILLSVISEKFNKIKRLFFKNFLLFTENTERMNKKYAIRLIIKMSKRRMICHKLNFFTRSNLN
jgi:hypothetical protein